MAESLAGGQGWHMLPTVLVPTGLGFPDSVPGHLASCAAGGSRALGTLAEAWAAPLLVGVPEAVAHGGQHPGAGGDTASSEGESSGSWDSETPVTQ